ncbi:MAG TPA: hypothetical protein VM120_09380 [Bryobacteraceae bacterium]|nr:hypothetical protein [Bryobacteraceae bacterium]
MASKNDKNRALVGAWLERNKPALIDPEIASALRRELESVSARAFHDLLRECDVPLAPLVEGVRQEDFQQLERTLLGLAQEYRDHPKECRAAVIEAKDHAKLAARNGKVDLPKRRQKEEMVLWMLTWLENPPIFELWVALRKNALIEAQSPPL